MGILKIFSKRSPAVQGLPRGSLTVDRHGHMIATTISSSFSPAIVDAIGTQVLRIFREARAAQLPLAEVNLHFASLQITARELRGGAVIFLKPKDPFNLMPQN